MNARGKIDCKGEGEDLTMAAHAERRLARLRARFEHRAEQLVRSGFLLRGSVVQTRKRCSSPGCGCHSDREKLHGPYWQWSGKVDGKMTSRSLSEEQVARYRAWMDNARHFDEIVEELHRISQEANEILREQEKEAAERARLAGDSS